MSALTLRVVVDLADESVRADRSGEEPEELVFDDWAEDPHGQIAAIGAKGWRLISISCWSKAAVYWFQHEKLEPYTMTRRLHDWAEREAFLPKTNEDFRLKLLQVVSATAELAKFL